MNLDKPRKKGRLRGDFNCEALIMVLRDREGREVGQALLAPDQVGGCAYCDRDLAPIYQVKLYERNHEPTCVCLTCLELVMEATS